MSKCFACPVKCGDKPCIVEKFNITNLCDKVNPDHPDYKKAYEVIIADKSCGTKNYKPTSEKSTKKAATPGSPAKPPGLFNQIKSFGKALVGHAASGFKKVSEEEYNRRISICESCEHYIKEEERCDVCRCKMTVKCNWSSSSCPLKPPKWSPVGDNTPEEIKAVENFSSQEVTTASCCGKN